MGDDTVNRTGAKRGRKADKSNALCLRLATDLRTGLYAGRLPGVTLLADRYDVSPATMQRALRQMESDGLVEIRPRSGTYVRGAREVHLIMVADSPEMKGAGGMPPLAFLAEYGALYESMAGTLAEFDVNLVFRSVFYEDADALRRLSDDVHGRMIVLLPPRRTAELYAMLPAERWIRVMGAQDYNCPVGHITYENGVIGELAAEYLLECGCRSFCFVGDEQSPLFRQRCDSFRDVLARRGMRLDLISLDWKTLSLSMVGSRIHAALAPRIEEIRGGECGIFCAADHFVLPVRQELAALGVALGEMHMVSCDNNPYYLSNIYPRPAEIDIGMAEIGAEAARRILGENEAFGAKMAIPPRLLLPER